MDHAGENTGGDPVAAGECKGHGRGLLLGPEHKDVIVRVRHGPRDSRTGMEIGKDDQPVGWTKVLKLGHTVPQSFRGGARVHE